MAAKPQSQPIRRQSLTIQQSRSTKTIAVRTGISARQGAPRRDQRSAHQCVTERVTSATRHSAKLKTSAISPDRFPLKLPG